MSSADWRCVGSSSGTTTAAGHDAVHGETLTLSIITPTTDLRKMKWSVVKKSPDAPALTFSPVSGEASPPNGNVTVVMPGSGIHCWLVRGQKNDGKDDAGQVVANWTVQRMIVIRSPAGHRKIVATERTEYDPENGWAEAIDDLVDVAAASTLPVTTGAHKVLVANAGNIPEWKKLLGDNIDPAMALVCASVTTGPAVCTTLTASDAMACTVSDAATTQLATCLTLTHRTSATAGVGYGVRILLRGEDASDNAEDLCAIDALWSDPTHTSEDSVLRLMARAAGAGLVELLSIIPNMITTPAAMVLATLSGALTLNGFAGLNLQGAGSTAISIDGTTVTLASGKHFTAAGGASAFNWSAASGNFQFSTGSLSWAGAAGKTASFVGADAFIITGGASSAWSLTSGTLTINAPVLLLQESGSTVLSLDNNACALGAGKTLNCTGGNVDLPSGANTLIGGVACHANLTAANLNKLIDGASDASALHNHGPAAEKASDESANNDATPTADAELKVASLPVGTHDFLLVAHIVAANATAGFRWTIGGTATATRFRCFSQLIEEANPSVLNRGVADVSFGFAARTTEITTANHLLLIWGSIVTSGAGSFEFQWSQKDAEVSNTTVKASSTLRMFSGAA